MDRVLLALWRRYRPREGWLPFFLLLAAVSCLTAAVVEADWVPEGRVVVLTATAGLFFGAGLPRRRAPTWLHGGLILLYGPLLTTLYLARLWPPLTVLAGGWESYARFNRAQVALFLDRWGGWLRAVSEGGSSRETIVFAFGLGFLAWLLAAYAGWSAIRERRPLAGLSAVGAALATSIYYSGTAIWTGVLFVPLTAMAAATLNMATLEEGWDEGAVSYPEQVRWDALIAAGIAAMTLVVFAYALPAVDVRALSARFFAQPVVREAEDAMERAFAGVRTPRQRGPGGGPGILPNDFLVGDAPELATTVRFTATVRPIPPPGAHWRGQSFDVYDGRRWSSSAERQEELAAGIPLPLAPLSATVALTQAVALSPGAGPARYTVGEPTRLDQGVVLFWRGVADLARVEGGGGPAYRAASRIGLPGAAALAAADPAAIPPLILGRYTQLPTDLPARVRDLAAEIAGPSPTAYAKARAIEAFLRQYPYTLDVPLPPAGRDAADYFLFELQEGYCDYYATAMVVLARAAGLPARLATGFLPQPPNEAGVQTVTWRNAHAWAEIYFAGFGWIEFEPTASFPILAPPEPLPGADTAPPSFTPAAPLETPPPIPTADSPWRRWLGPLAAGLLLVTALGLGWRRRRRGLPRHGLDAAYARLQASARSLGVATPPSQTPAEFTAALGRRLATWEQSGRAAGWAAVIRKEGRRLAELYARRRYARAAGRATADGEAARSWRALRGPLWRLRVRGWLRARARSRADAAGESPRQS